MKKALIAPLLLLFVSHLQAQERVKEKDIVGQSWQLIIDLDDAFEEAERDLEDEDSFLGKMILGSVSGLVTTIIDEMEIYMEFQANGQVAVRVLAFGEEEIEYSDWRIDSKGRLFIDDTDSFQSDHDYWLYEDGILVSFENGERQKEVYMVRLDP